MDDPTSDLTSTEESRNQPITDNVDEGEKNYAVDNLTDGLLVRLLPELQKCQATLTEVSENQNILYETLQQENAKFSACALYDETAELMAKAQRYHVLLQNVRRDMLLVRDKTTKLKRRAVRLQQQKEKEILKQAQEREREKAREQKLVAKPASTTNKAGQGLI